MPTPLTVYEKVKVSTATQVIRDAGLEPDAQYAEYLLGHDRIRKSLASEMGGADYKILSGEIWIHEDLLPADGFMQCDPRVLKLAAVLVIVGRLIDKREHDKQYIAKYVNLWGTRWWESEVQNLRDALGASMRFLKNVRADAWWIWPDNDAACHEQLALKAQALYSEYRVAKANLNPGADLEGR